MKPFIKLLPLLLIGVVNAQQGQRFTYDDIVNGQRGTTNPTPQYSRQQPVQNSYWNGEYTGKYDSTFGMGIKGIYAFSSADASEGKLAPDMAGALLDIHANIESGTSGFFHEISLTTGYMGSPKKARFSASEVDQWSGNTMNAAAKHKAEMIPLMIGYTVNIPIVQEKVYFYLGAKGGCMFGYGKLTLFGEELDSQGRIVDEETYTQHDSLTDWAYSFNAGFRFAISDATDFILGYELFVLREVQNEKYTYHAIEAGFSWTF